MATHALDELQELVDALQAAGPDAATLCEPWTTAELSAHLVLRESSWTESAALLPIPALRKL